MKIHLRILCLVIAVLFLSSCVEKFGKKPRYKKITKEPAVEEIAPYPADRGATTPQRNASARIMDKGVTELNAGNYEQALQTFQSAVNVDSSNGIAYYYLALSNFKLERPDVALGLLDKAEALLQHAPVWMDKVQTLRSSIHGKGVEEVED